MFPTNNKTFITEIIPLELTNHETNKDGINHAFQSYSAVAEEMSAESKPDSASTLQRWMGQMQRVISDMVKAPSIRLVQK